MGSNGQILSKIVTIIFAIQSDNLDSVASLKKKKKIGDKENSWLLQYFRDEKHI